MHFAERFANKSAIITGGAKGIGRATVLRFLREGGKATVIELEGEQTEWAISLRKEAEAMGASLVYIVGNAADEKQVAKNVDAAIARHGVPNILINNVGNSMNTAPLDELSLDQWEAAMKTNLTTAFLMTRALLPHMRKNGGGAIVSMSSIAGTHISENAHLSYHAAKAGIVGFTHKLAYEEGPYGIRANAVAPGTTLTERVLPRYNTLSPEALKKRMDVIPLRRTAKPEEMAAVILFLASDDASYITGVTINANGGRFMV